MRKIRGFIFVFFLLIACSAKATPEEQLRQIFTQELILVERFQGDYVGYMEHQIKNFSGKQKEMASTIMAINKKFSRLSLSERPVYEEKWRREFSPLMHALVEKTDIMVKRQDENSEPMQLAKIQELSLKMAVREKQTAQVSLIPRFYED